MRFAVNVVCTQTVDFNRKIISVLGIMEGTNEDEVKGISYTQVKEKYPHHQIELIQCLKIEEKE